MCLKARRHPLSNIDGAGLCTLVDIGCMFYTSIQGTYFYQVIFGTKHPKVSLYILSAIKSTEINTLWIPMVLENIKHCTCTSTQHIFAMQKELKIHWTNKQHINFWTIHPSITLKIQKSQIAISVLNQSSISAVFSIVRFAGE